MTKYILPILMLFMLLGCSSEFPEYKYEDAVFDLIGIKFETVSDIENWIYFNIYYLSDGAGYSLPEYWASPLQTIKNGYGDCEDFAILYMYLLYEITGEKSELVVFSLPGNFHAAVKDSHHDYLYSPQAPSWVNYEEGHSYVRCYTYDYVMYNATSFNNKGEMNDKGFSEYSKN